MPERLAFRLYQGFWSALDWLYPPICAGCGAQGRILGGASASRWCVRCNQDVQRVLPPLCSVCGQSQRTASLCDQCRNAPPHFNFLRSWGFFEGGLRKAIHRLKYRKDIALGEVLARPMIRLLDELLWVFDVVIQVPLSLARLAERGYNQDSLLAKPVALNRGVVYCSQSLARVRETASQVGLPAQARWENVAGAFHAREDLVARKRVLLIDDVATTGATMDACAASLIAAGAQQVMCLTLARSAFSADGAKNHNQEARP